MDIKKPRWSPGNWSRTTPFLAGALLVAAGCGKNNVVVNHPTGPRAEHRTTHRPLRKLPKGVLSDVYSNGVRIVNFAPTYPDVLLQVDESCEYADLIKTTVRLSFTKGQYEATAELDTDYKSPLCTTGELPLHAPLPTPEPAAPDTPPPVTQLPTGSPI